MTRGTDTFSGICYCSDVTTLGGGRSDMRLGLREANQRFSKAIKAVKAGQEVVLTERGAPIAVIKPIAAPQTREDTSAIVERLQSLGLLRRAQKQRPMPGGRPVTIKGGPLSRTVREERDATG